MRYAAENEREKNMQSQHRMLSKVIAAVGFSALMVAQLSADEIAVGNYGIAANGMPYAVALEKKFFQQEGANVTGIISSQGGGTSIRNMLSGGVAYGEANPGVTAVAIQQGADLKIVSDNVLTVAEFVWAVKPDSSIKSIKDFKGKKIGYTNPRSTSQALAILLLHAAGYKSEDAELVKTGGFGEGRARYRPHRRGANGRAGMVEVQVEIPRCRHSKRNPAAARQRRRRDDRRCRREQGRFHSCGDPRSPKGGRVHERQSR
jgi:hypothetical protein